MSCATTEPAAPFVPSDAEVALARESSRELGKLLQAREQDAVRVQVLDDGDGGSVLTLPASSLRLLLTILTEMECGNAVTLVPVHVELSTQQAADLLNVSRPHLVKLLEGGEIPFRLVGRHRRVLARDLLWYKQRIDAAREETLDRLTALSQELGLDEPDPPP